ncbi:FAD-binding protein [Mycolicibacterium llatzerense]|uniref:FAD-binding protein n=1 Tax=Mycolicibacterium llatzerense TaxID=280871 RepID=UPI0021B56E15|nr:FAD-binding protein [Mycolicibacterium llatzerense]MCT7364421.1 23S rRNA methyltransferase [Mycolicibacterium llatzerense]MCT7373164.1 23S rRNA methyltransferase [Mycolicibacterium llatzerense]
MSGVTADVVVVGYGAAGVCAALEARAQGADVLAIDRFNGGGATQVSGGIIYAGGGTWVQREAGIDDSADAMYTYLRAEVGDSVRPETLRRFVDGSPAMIDWLTEHGVPFEASVCPYKTSYPNNKYYLYYSGSENSGHFRALTPPVQRGHRAKGPGASGKKIYQPLAESASRAGVRTMFHTRAESLLTDSTGRVVGVRTSTLAHAPAWVKRRYAAYAALAVKPGIYYPPLRATLERRLSALERRYAQTIDVHARKGVILCAGGYIANRELIEQHAPAYRDGLQLGTSADDGSGMQLAIDVGAAVDRLDNVSAWRFITPPSAMLGGLVVDERGQRFIDETRYGAAIGNAMVQHHNGRGWVLTDRALLEQARKQLPQQAIWFQRLQMEAMLRTDRVEADTLEAVATKAGVDPAGLLQTVTEHNEAAASGDPDPMGKPADFVHPIEQGPYSLIAISIKRSLINPCPMFTLGGLIVDEETGAVKTPQGQPIYGLFAAGRTAVGICANSYVSGLSLADCVYSGRRAGAHAVHAAASA